MGTLNVTFGPIWVSHSCILSSYDNMFVYFKPRGVSYTVCVTDISSPWVFDSSGKMPRKGGPLTKERDQQEKNFSFGHCPNYGGGVYPCPDFWPPFLPSNSP